MKTLLCLILVYSSVSFADARFQIVPHPVNNNIAYLIDTTTGKLWQKVCVGDPCKSFVFEQVVIEGITMDKKTFNEIVTALSK